MRVLLVSLIMIQFSAAAELDEHQKRGLEDTRKMMTDPSLREHALKTQPEGQRVDEKVEQLTGKGKGKEEIYGLASEVLEVIARESGGDPEKMQKILSEAQANPEKFYEKYFTPAQKRRVRSLANEIERKQGPARK